MEQVKDAKKLIAQTKIDADFLFSEDAPKPVIAPPDPAKSWQRLTEVTLDTRTLRRNCVFQDRRDHQAAHFDGMRARVLHHMRAVGGTRLAITAPREACGKTTIAANLALSLARHEDLRIMLIDLDLRRPTLIHHLGLQDRGPRFSALLAGTRSFATTTLRVGKNLALSLNATASETPSELLAAANTNQLLDAVQKDYAPDLMIFDTAPLLDADDTLGLLTMTDAALLIARADRSQMQDIDTAERLVAERTKCLGTILNQSRFS